MSAPGISFALARLVAGKVDATAFVEIGPDDIVVHALGVDEGGVPVLRPEASHSVPWTAILPVMRCQRSIAVSTYCGSSSIA